MSYVGAIQKLIGTIGPYYIHGKQIGGFLEACGFVCDSQVQTLVMGLRLGHPLTCDVSALPIIAPDRQIRIYPSESEASKRFRLSRWKQLHREQASHIGEMRHTQPYFMPYSPMMRIVHQDGLGASATWHTLTASGEYQIHRATPSNWNWDNRPSRWSRFWVIIYAPQSFIETPRYGDGTRYSDGTRYASAATQQMSRDLVDMILEWKAAHSRLAGYIVATDPASFDPTSTAQTSASGWTSLPVGNWGQPISPQGVRTRLPSAYWLHDTGML